MWRTDDYTMVCVRERHYGSIWYVCGGEINDSAMACLWRRNDGVMVCHCMEETE